MIYDSELVEKTLGNLGDTPTQVGQSLMDAGVKGARGDGEACVIAKFLNAEVGNSGGWDVNDTNIVQVDAWYGGFKGYEPIDTPTHVAQFIKDFDHGYWPQLEEK